MKIIPLTQGKISLVDDEEYEELSKHKWHVTKSSCNWYARRRDGKGMMYMHRQIMNCSKGQEVHHKGFGLVQLEFMLVEDNFILVNNTLNNCRTNLVRCSRQVNLTYRQYG